MTDGAHTITPTLAPGDVVIGRFPKGDKRQFRHTKIRPVLVIDVNYDPVLKMPVITVLRISTKRRVLDSANFGGAGGIEIKSILDLREDWELPSGETTRYIALGGAIDFPMHRIFFPEITQEGKLERIGRIGKRTLQNILMKRAIMSKDSDRTILEKFIANSERIIANVPPERRVQTRFSSSAHRSKIEPSG